MKDERRCDRYTRSRRKIYCDEISTRCYFREAACADSGTSRRSPQELKNDLGANIATQKNITPTRLVGLQLELYGVG
jgi:hypothetical protein